MISIMEIQKSTTLNDLKFGRAFLYNNVYYLKLDGYIHEAKPGFTLVLNIKTSKIMYLAPLSKIEPVSLQVTIT